MNICIGNTLKKQIKTPKAFTIVELLVVIVAIGILATITIVSYSGITKRAIEVGLKQELASNSKLLKMYYVEYGYYPSSLDADKCPLTPTVDKKYCLKSMSGASLEYIGDTQTFELINKHASSNVAYKITDDGTMSLFAPGPWKQISVSNSHSCAIALDNKIYCWGGNGYGQMGDGTTVGKDTPTAVALGDRPSLEAKVVRSGGNTTCAIAMNDQLYCWGYNNLGGVGDGTTINKLVPTAVAQGDRVSLTVKNIELSTESNTTCAIATNNYAYCWGLNDFGQIGDATLTTRTVPKSVVLGDRSSLEVSQISVGSVHTCAANMDSILYCWGYNGKGGIGDGTLDNKHQPTAVALGTRPTLNIKSISAGKHFNCAISTNDQLYCWGYNGFGALGNGTAVGSSVPGSIVLGAMPSLKVKSVASSNAYNVCVINSNDQAYCWGRNDYLQLGSGTNDSFIYTPTAVVLGARPSLNLKSISTASSTTCAIDNKDKIFCWGTPSPTPIEVIAP